MEANLAFYNLFNTAYYQPVSNDFQQLTLQQDGLVIWGRLGYKL
jgi:outer membrane receptor protein involved in Fe transport